MTTQSKHTPGPWTISLGVSLIDAVWDSEGQFKIADFICGRKRNWQEGNANARLIASSPDLLAALQELVTAVEYCAEHKMDAPDLDVRNGLGWSLARAAIAKATKGE